MFVHKNAQSGMKNITKKRKNKKRFANLKQKRRKIYRRVEKSKNFVLEPQLNKK